MQILLISLQSEISMQYLNDTILKYRIIRKKTNDIYFIYVII